MNGKCSVCNSEHCRCQPEPREYLCKGGCGTWITRGNYCEDCEDILIDLRG